VRLAIFGATGRTGRYLTELALNAGHEVVVLVRDPAKLKLSHGRLRVVGDARDFDRVLEVVQGAGAVLSTLGPRRNSPSDGEAHVIAVQNVIEAMRRTGVRRLVTVLGAAVDFPGDQKGLFDRLAGWCSGLPAIFTGRRCNRIHAPPG
jgi:putative NADH-flavin reductase